MARRPVSATLVYTLVLLTVIAASGVLTTPVVDMKSAEIITNAEEPSQGQQKGEEGVKTVKVVSLTEQEEQPEGVKSSSKRQGRFHYYPGGIGGMYPGFGGYPSFGGGYASASASASASSYGGGFYGKK